MNRRALRASLVASLISGAALAFAAAASACSCAPLEPRTALKRADAAFVGAPLRSRSADDGIVITYRVDEALKGRLGRTVDVETSGNGGSCGLDPGDRRTIGLLLDRRGGRFEAGSCDVVPPAELRTAAKPRPAPDGAGAVKFVVGGEFGGVRLLALDRRGRTLAYGAGGGGALHLAPCPGGRRIVELHRKDFGAMSLTVRELPSLRATRTRPLPLKDGWYPTDVVCRDGTGDEVVLLAENEEEGPRFEGELTSLTGSATRLLYRGRAGEGDLAGSGAYLAQPGGGVYAVDLDTGARTRVASAPRGVDQLAASEDGSLLALTSVRNERTAITSIDLRGERPITRTITPATRSDLPVFYTLAWAAGGRLVAADEGTVDVYDPALRRAGRFGPFLTTTPVPDGSRIYGAGEGALLGADLPRGPTERVRRLPGSIVRALAVLPSAQPRRSATLAACHRTH